MKRFYAVLGLSLLLNSCGIWTNFTTYFNVYYNAKTSYETALVEMSADKAEMFEFKHKKINQKANQSFDKVIEKCSKILEKGEASSYFDDALYMTGRAFYHKQEYSKSLRKFLELRTLNESDYYDESLLWIGRAQLQLLDYNDGTASLDSLISVTEDDELKFEALKSIVAYHKSEENYRTAIPYLNRMAELSDDYVVKSALFYELGNLYNLTGEYELASKTFKDVVQYESEPDIEFKSYIELVKIYKRNGETEQASELLSELRSLNRYNPYYDNILLEEGYIFLEKGLAEDAFKNFKVIDSLYALSPSAPKARLRLAGLFDQKYNNYDSALAYYDKALGGQNLTFEERNEAARKKSGLAKYFEVEKQIAGFNRQMLYLTDKYYFNEDSLKYEKEMVRLDSINKAAGVFDETPAETKNTEFRSGRGERFTDTKPTAQNTKKETVIQVITKPVFPAVSADSLKSLRSTVYFEKANLFFTDLDNLDSAGYYYTAVINEGNDPETKAQAMYSLAAYYASKGDKTKSDSLHNEIFENFSFTNLAAESARILGKKNFVSGKDKAEKAFVEAEKLYDENKKSEAKNSFSKIIKENPGSIQAEKSLVYLGRIYENDLNMPDSAYFAYNALLTDYPKSGLYKLVSDKVSVYRDSVIGKNEAVIPDSSEKAVSPVTGEIIEKIEEPMAPFRENTDAVEPEKSPVDTEKKRRTDVEL